MSRGMHTIPPVHYIQRASNYVSLREQIKSFPLVKNCKSSHSSEFWFLLKPIAASSLPRGHSAWCLQTGCRDHSCCREDLLRSLCLSRAGSRAALGSGACFELLLEGSGAASSLGTWPRFRRPVLLLFPAERSQTTVSAHQLRRL